MKHITIRFTKRRRGKDKRYSEITHFYHSISGRIFHAKCEQGIIISFLERFGNRVHRSKSGKTIHVEGDIAEDILKRLVILAGNRQCLRRPTKIPDIADVVISLGEFETMFWYSKIIEEYEKHGYWGVCRVVKAFRILYRIS